MVKQVPCILKFTGPAILIMKSTAAFLYRDKGCLTVSLDWICLKKAKLLENGKYFTFLQLKTNDRLKRILQKTQINKQMMSTFVHKQNCHILVTELPRKLKEHTHYEYCEIILI